MYRIEYESCDRVIDEIDEEFNSIEDANKWLEDNGEWVVEWRWYEIFEV